MGNHLAPAASSRHPQPSPGPAAGNGGGSIASSSSDDVDVPALPQDASDGGDVDVGIDVPVPVPDLPQDVLLDILLRSRLPARQLCRLRGVCRSWRAVLSAPLFVAAHAAGHPDLLVAAADADLSHDAVMRMTTSTAGPSWRPRYYYPQHYYMRAHLGRVLVVAADKRPRVLDPVTGADSLLPDHADHHGESVTFFVLGWAAASNGGYKVLSITLDRGSHVQVQRCKVLTLGNVGVSGGGGVWREAPSTPVHVKHEPWAATVAGDGVVYVLASARRIGAEWIAAFDLGTERWRRGLLRGPPSNALSSLTESGGRLVAVSGSFSYASAVHLWRLVRDGDGDGDAVWHKTCTVHLSRIIIQPGAGGVHERIEIAKPLSRVMQRGVHHERTEVAQPLWVLDGGGRIAFLVCLQGCSPLSPAGNKKWVLRVYDPKTKGFEDAARVSCYVDVAIGVYSANNLLRA